MFYSSVERLPGHIAIITTCRLKSLCLRSCWSVWPLPTVSSVLRGFHKSYGFCERWMVKKRDAWQFRRMPPDAKKPMKNLSTATKMHPENAYICVTFLPPNICVWKQQVKTHGGHHLESISQTFGASDKGTSQNQALQRDCIHLWQMQSLHIFIIYIPFQTNNT